MDFTTKVDGDPPARLDTGQPVDFILDKMSGRKPQIAQGKLVPGDLPASGSFATYYQAQLDGDCRSFGTSWVVNRLTGTTTNGIMCLAAWSKIYDPPGVAVPKTPAHITISTVGGYWKWWVSDGEGDGADRLHVVKQGRFLPPPSDGVSVWDAAVSLNGVDGVGHLLLPGNDLETGMREVQLTDAEISASLAKRDLPPTTIGATLSGADVVVVEHFASESPRTARYPGFLKLWAKTGDPS